MRLATKRIASLTCAAALMGSLAACSSNTSTASSSESAGAAEGGTAVENNAVVTIEKGSTWTLTGDCTLTSLTDNGTINFNGYTITLADGTVLK